MDRCARCPARRDPDDPASLAWTCERAANGTRTWLCPACTRRHARDIEAKLAGEWW